MKTAPRGHHWHHVPVASSAKKTLPGAGVTPSTSKEEELFVVLNSTVPLFTFEIVVAMLFPPAKVV